MNNKNMSYAKNIQSINFDNRTERKGKQNFRLCEKRWRY